jgi:hypothetical protein
MKRAYLLVVVAIVVATLLGIAVARHSGYVLIAYDSFRYESTLWATLALLVAVVLAVWLLRVLLGLVFVSTGVVNPWSRHNRSRRTRLAIEQGQLDLAEGRWASAQRHLHRAAEAERQPLLYYLGAARAANELGGTGNGLLAVARTRKAANGPLPGNHTGGSEHCQCHDTARRCRAPDARANKKRPPKRAPVQSGKSEGIKLRGWGPGRHPAGSHPRPCRPPQ